MPIFSQAGLAVDIGGGGGVHDDFVGSSTSSFMEAARRLARSYYSHVALDPRPITRGLVDVQAAFEVAYSQLGEFERLQTTISHVGFATVGLEQALRRGLVELELIGRQVRDHIAGLAASEHFNLRLMDQLRRIDGDLASGVEAGRSLELGSGSWTGRPTSQSDGLVPTSVKKKLQRACAAPRLDLDPYDLDVNADVDLDGDIEVDIDGSNGLEVLLSGETAPQAAWLAEVRRDLADRHAEFSFLQIALWRQTAGLRRPVRGSGKSSRAGTNGKVNVDVSAESVMLLPGDSGQSRAPNDAGLLLRYLYPRITRSGQTISDELDRLRGVQTQVDRRHAQLTQQMRRRRGQLVDGLLAGHIAVQTLLEMAEKNDSLIGRLVKARPLFAQLRRIIMAGPDDAITALPTSRSKPESEEEEDKDGGEMRNGYSTA